MNLRRYYNATRYLAEDYSFEQLNPCISLKSFTEAYGYRILGLSLNLGEYVTPVGGGSPKFYVKTQKTIMVTAMICNNTTGMVSYVTIPPYYRINQKKISRYPKTCDDVIIRFTIRRDCRGFFKPEWLSCIKGEQVFTPYPASSNRIDYVSLFDNCITYKGFSALRALGSSMGMQESLELVFHEWLHLNSERLNIDDCFSGRRIIRA